MITLNQLITLYQDIATRHKQVNDFLAVQDFNIEMDNAPVYPLLVVNPVSANLPRTDNGYTSFNTTFELQVLDLVNKDNNNRMDVMSDTQQIITDVVNEFNTHPYYIDNSIDTISDISFDPIRGAYGGDVDGWKISITLEHPVQLSYCSAPVLPIQGFDYSSPAVTVIDGGNTFELYPADSYTCQSAEPKDGIQYQRPLPTGQTTSYATYDNAWQVANNPYPAPPTNPETVQELINFYTLKYDNAFSNKFRFTDRAGLEAVNSAGVISLDTCIDHLTGLEWGCNNMQTGNAKSWQTSLSEINSLSIYGHNDWFLPNAFELDSVLNLESSSAFIFSAVNITFWTSTTASFQTANALRYQFNAPTASGAKTGNSNYIPVRKIY